MQTNIQAAETKTNNPKVFFALWPGLALRRHLHRLAVQYQTICGGRVMQAESIHLTLLFLGVVERTKLEQLQQAVNGLTINAFSFYLQQFSGWRHNRIGYAAPSEDVAALRQLSDTLRQVTASTGIDCDVRTFAPHVTLLRNMGRHIDVQPIPDAEWRVEAFSLVESVPTDQGVQYRPLQTWPCRK